MFFRGAFSCKRQGNYWWITSLETCFEILLGWDYFSFNLTARVNPLVTDAVFTLSVAHGFKWSLNCLPNHYNLVTLSTPNCLPCDGQLLKSLLTLLQPSAIVFPLESLESHLDTHSSRVRQGLEENLYAYFRASHSVIFSFPEFSPQLPPLLLRSIWTVSLWLYSWMTLTCKLTVVLKVWSWDHQYY